MNNETFLRLVEDEVSLIMKTIGKKQKEYNFTEDRLDQFKKCGNFRDQHPMQALAGMLIKHTSSVYDCIDQTAEGNIIDLKVWEEKITDHIIYLLLLMGLAHEEKLKRGSPSGSSVGSCVSGGKTEKSIIGDGRMI